MPIEFAYFATYLPINYDLTKMIRHSTKIGNIVSTQ